MAFIGEKLQLKRFVLLTQGVGQLQRVSDRNDVIHFAVDQQERTIDLVHVVYG